MNAKQLKYSILQYAMQGKLVPQLETDEPTIKLIERIKVEKELLIKDKRTKKEKPLPPIMEDEIPFEIPETWEWMRLNELALYIKAGGDKPKEFSDEQTVDFPIPVIANGKINKGIVGYTKVAKEDGDCITISGRGTIGYAEIRYEPFVPIVRLIVLKPSMNVSMEYLKVTLEALIETGVGTSIPQLTVPMISPKLIPLPPLEEQHRIAKKVKKLFDKVDEYDDKYLEIKSLKELFPVELEKSILQYAMQGKLVEQDATDEPAQQLIEKIQLEKERLIKEKVIKKEKPLSPITEEEIPFDIPSSWEWVRLNDISVYIQRGKSPKYSTVEEIPVISQKCIQWSGFNIEPAKFIEPSTLEKYDEIRLLKTNDILWNSTGLGTIGRVGIYDSKLNPYTLAVVDSHVTVVRTSELIDTEFIYYYLASPTIQDSIEDIASGSTKQKELNTSTIKEILIPLPPYEEQKRIVKKINEFLSVSRELIK